MSLWGSQSDDRAVEGTEKVPERADPPQAPLQVVVRPAASGSDAVSPSAIESAGDPVSGDEILDVIFIGGASRTGSTLLSLILGSLPGYFAAGEIRYLWLRGLLGNQLCECREPFRSCPLWREVIGTGLGSVEGVGLEYAQLWKATATPMSVLRGLGPAPSHLVAQRHRYLDALRRVLVAISRITRSRFIVDASKYATDALLLHEVPGVRVHAIHLVRDSRAVAYSWQRPKRRPEIHWREAHMELMSPGRSSFHWGSMNAAMEFTRRRTERYDRIRYEDLVRDPIGVLTPLLPREVTPSIAGILSEGAVRPATGHSFSGNPRRFEARPLAIHADTRWVSALGEADFNLVTAMTWPLLVRYGYPLSRRAWARSFGGDP